MPCWTSVEPDGEVDITLRMDKEGPGSWEPKTVIQVLQQTVQQHGSKPALRFKNDAKDEEWQTVTWDQYYQRIMAFAKALLSLNFTPHRSVNIIGSNSPEWFIANCGAIAAGGMAVGIYSTNSPEAYAYITEHSEAEVVVVEDKKQLDKFTAMAHRLPNLKALVMWKGTQEEVDAACPPTYLWEDFIKLGANVPDHRLKERINGPPKAVMISHDNLTWTARMFSESFPKPLDSNDRCISYLPMSHIAAQSKDIYMPMCCGSTAYFALPDALRGSLITSLQEIQPTYFLGVPRVWEKIYERLRSLIRNNVGLKKMMTEWAQNKCLKKNNSLQYGVNGGVPLAYPIASALVLSKLKASVGLDKAKIMLTAAAPASVEMLNFFASLDICVMELFGQSECTGPHTTNYPHAWKIGTIGRTIPAVKSKAMEGTGELCLWGRHVMMGYLKMPDKTAETIDSEGWLHSGDVAHMDSEGFWTITGRIKELIITAGGENIPPLLIEEAFKSEPLLAPVLSNAMVVGDKRKFLSILLCLKTQVGADGQHTSKLSLEVVAVGRSLGSKALTVEEVMEDPLWQKYLDEGVKQANTKAISSAQRIQKWAILPQDFSEKGGELTPTLKLRRSEVVKKYGKFIDNLYNNSSLPSSSSSSSKRIAPHQDFSRGKVVFS